MTTSAETDKAKLLNRLRRLEGQVRGLSKMIEEDRPCQEILTLLSGVRSALEATGDLILEQYLESCQAGLQSGQTDPAELVRTLRLARR
ncbi:DNA-binding FrmR family transcriptional regulator [Deinobacterium chartae]|uniref:DNA-binding FrmR family transcriptional regulator n=1 Tax=Deinobacterium chartae TaxID=521158 RepID=A0A841HU13_9DEIO|nr:metal-sensitive transcriptional regulator [Deinobacterium chartae]MBB6096921.1 DNA-binding FrmR family transcriptional regulator [Deinobacterium chartae]